jgi:hypothetical protein
VQAMLDHLHLALPSQPAPRIKASPAAASPLPAKTSWRPDVAVVKTAG